METWPFPFIFRRNYSSYYEEVILMDLTMFTWWINLFIAGCIITICVHIFRKKREEKRHKEYVKFMREHNIKVTGL